MLDRSQEIRVIDLFAGPGGLGEGFASFKNGNYDPFKIVLSIEKDPIAFKTLQLRSFFRQFKKGDVPDEYYQYLRGEIKGSTLFKRYPAEYKRAKQATWLLELGSSNASPKKVNERINAALDGSNNWVLIGGPPCQAFSLIGRVKIKSDSEKKQKDFDKDHRHFLYREYLKIIATHKPSVFVMENVPGILSSKVNGTNTFERILSDLKNPDKAISVLNGYPTQNNKESLTYNIYSLVRPSENANELQPADYIIKSESYGIPQARHRVILLGIRSDIQTRPGQLAQSSLPISMWEAISGLAKIRSKLSKEPDSNDLWKSVLHSIPQYKWFDDSKLEEPLKEMLKKACINDETPNNTGAEFIPGAVQVKFRPEWFGDRRIKGQCNHSSRSHIRGDLQRYFFASCFAEVYGRSPKIGDFPKELLPKHANVQKAIEESLFSDRFRVQVRYKPSTTITSHISKDGHYYIHPDVQQCRSLTVREAARLQTFPDNYLFEGPRTEQYHQVGNAVPPLLANQIAKVVYRLFTKYQKE
ncbi:DNA cytosine methyltransferase [Dehalococcoides mccartyi]|uniref:DNA (cytosine-5-)-methyltransferase n=1 Tax=Dehalococcoides mccartyi TaxID=61435 RepID=A0A328EN59_9CHLR|nr:DNA cytosine methyltransferase [Dehalococcoides mccartyi]AII60312.1 DNA-cytosine methyltransferase [Dehalococcoides mccartyi CG5]RAL70082.1 DNA-cytosine methyltransferase [Dehalococcoides mccartyi]